MSSPQPYGESLQATVIDHSNTINESPVFIQDARIPDSPRSDTTIICDSDTSDISSTDVLINPTEASAVNLATRAAGLCVLPIEASHDGPKTPILVRDYRSKKMVPNRPPYHAVREEKTRRFVDDIQTQSEQVRRELRLVKEQLQCEKSDKLIQSKRAADAFSEVERLRAKVMSMDKTIAVMNDQIDDMSSRASVHEGKVTSLESVVETLKSENRELRNNIMAYEEEYSRLEVCYNAVRDSTQRLKRRYHREFSTIKELAAGLIAELGRSTAHDPQTERLKQVQAHERERIRVAVDQLASMQERYMQIMCQLQETVVDESNHNQAPITARLRDICDIAGSLSQGLVSGKETKLESLRSL